MARIPDQVGRQVRVAPIGDAGFSMRAPDASGLEQGLAQAESAFLRRAEQEREEAETAQVKAAAAQYEQFEQDLKFNPERGLFTQKAGNAQNITNRGLADLDKKYEEIVSGISNERVRQRFGDYRASQRIRTNEELNRYEFGENQAYKDQVDSGLLETNLQGAALYYNDPAKVDEYRAKVAGLMTARAKRKGIAGEQLQADLLKTGSALLSGVIQRQASGDPYRAREYFKAQQGSMTADDQVRVGNLLDREIKAREIEARQQQAIARAELSSRVSDASAAYLSGFDYADPPGEADFVASYGADEGRERFAQFQRTQALGGAMQQLATASPEERMQILQQYSPVRDGVARDGFQADAKAYGVLVNAAGRLGKELQGDPAAYVASRSPDVQRAAQALQGGDPAAAEAYAAATIAEQLRLGVAEPKLLTDAQASNIAASFKQTEDGGSNAASLVRQLQDQWGKNWPTVYRQLNGKLPAAAMVIGTGVDEQTASTLARISGMKTEELKKGIPAADTKAVRDSLSEQMAEFRATLSGQAGGERTFATLYDEMERLSYAYMGQGKSAEDAVEQAYKSVVDDRYTMKGSWRAPKDLDADLIEAGAERTLRQLDPADMEYAVPPGFSEEFARERVKAAIDRDGYWVTLPDESGLALYYGGEAVLDKQGRPISRGWDDLTGNAVIEGGGANAFELRRNGGR